MPRRGNVPKREILPDPLYNSVLVTKLINGVMLDGKKGVAQKVVYDAFDYFSDQEDAAIYFESPVETYQYDDPDNGVWVDDFMGATWDNNEVLVAFYSETAPANPTANDYRYWHYDASNNKVLYE